MGKREPYRRKKIGILGGTFNPIHKGHLYLAKKAMEAAKLDQILFVPSGVSYMKEQSQILPAAQRLRMVELAIQDQPAFAASAIEIEKTGNSYSDETIAALQKEQPDAEFFFLTGADTIFSMEQWKNPSAIFQAVTVLAAYRTGVSLEALKQQIAHLESCYRADIRLVAVGHVDISSSDIRKRIREGSSVRELLPEAVEAYIAQQHFYE